MPSRSSSAVVVPRRPESSSRLLASATRALGGAHLGLATRAESLGRAGTRGARLGDPGGRRGLVRAETILGRVLPRGETRFLRLERRELRRERLPRGLGVDERRRDPLQLAGERVRRRGPREHGRERRAGTPTLVDECELPAPPLAQLFETADDRRELVGACRAQFLLDGREAAAEGLEPAVASDEVRVELRRLRVEGGEPPAQFGELTSGKMEPQRPELRFELTVLARRGRLALERPELAFDLPQQVLDAGEPRLARLEPALSAARDGGGT